ncbi:MAG: alpha/beta fold hydrolase [Deltaproteobacteria bacterium]|jgi:alpha-beta hydrolase superfamily lysophospholipase|nr:alpha/beta fold hydrolase [Deltaproteobacteria bacterium]
MDQKNIAFTSNGLSLRGILHHPRIPLPPVVIGSHGLLSNSNSPKQLALAKACNAHGIAFFRFDHRGCGQSEGDFKEVTSLAARCNDLISAIKTIQLRKDTGDRISLFGSSMGGAVCISATAYFDIDSLVTFASPVRTASITESQAKSDDADSMDSTFDRKALQWDISDRLKNLHHILIVHGDSDQIVPVSNAFEIYEKAGNPKKMIIQKNGDHRMSNEIHQEDFVIKAALWFQKCFSGALET